MSTEIEYRDALVERLRQHQQNHELPRPVLDAIGEAAVWIGADEWHQRAITAEASLEKVVAEVARCHARLEIDHAFKADAAGEKLVRFEIPYDERAGWPDAVSCRDATISLLDDRVAALTERAEKAERHRDKLISELNTLASDAETATRMNAVDRRALELERERAETAERRLRDEFAGRALAGMLAHSTRYRPRDGRPDWHSAIAEEAYEIADAMLKARQP